ncbi:hypothetical protein AK812_SmicGene46297, partial [Symbiodinium microadriaticum]
MNSWVRMIKQHLLKAPAPDWRYEGISCLEAITHVLGKKHSRDRFIVEKLRGSEASDLEVPVRDLELNLHEGRWGTMVNTCKSLLSVRPVFAYWTPDIISQDPPGPHASQADREGYTSFCNMRDSMTKSVRDSSWWEYLRMILRLARVLDHLEHWLEACPCHFKQVLETSLAGNRIFNTRYDCAMSGRRGPELAAGALDAILRDNFGTQRTQLLMACSSLQPEDADKICHDFSVGQAKLEQFLVLKFSFWGALPHKLCVLGHHDEAEARAGLKAAKDMFEEHPSSDQHHALTEHFFRGPLAGDIDAFIERRLARSDSQGFLCEAAACAFVSCVERSIEARHALLKAKTELMKRISPATFSLAIRSHEFYRRCLNNAEMLSEWQKHVLRLKKTSRHGYPYVIDMLGFAQHPEIHRSRGLFHRVRLRDAAHVIYHCDLETQYDRQALAGSTMQQPAYRDNPDSAAKLRKLVSSQSTDEDKHRAMLRVVMHEHFHHKCQEGAIYSLTGHVPAPRLLQDALVPKPKPRAPEARQEVVHPQADAQMFQEPDLDPWTTPQPAQSLELSAVPSDATPVLFVQ